MALSGTIKKAYGTAYEAQIRWTAETVPKFV